MSKIVDGSILVFSLKILSESFLHFVGIKDIYNSVREEREKSILCKTRQFGDLVSWLVPIASSIREITNWPNCHFCPIVLQLSWPFNFLHASHVWHFGELPVASHSWDPIARILQCTHTWISSHSFTHNPYIIPT